MFCLIQKMNRSKKNRVGGINNNWRVSFIKICFISTLKIIFVLQKREEENLFVRIISSVVLFSLSSKCISSIIILMKSAVFGAFFDKQIRKRQVVWCKNNVFCACEKIYLSWKCKSHFICNLSLMREEISKDLFVKSVKKEIKGFFLQNNSLISSKNDVDNQLFGKRFTDLNFSEE